jgi:hypothetical protein
VVDEAPKKRAVPAKKTRKKAAAPKKSRSTTDKGVAGGATERQRRWRAANRDRYNAAMRAYRKKRKVKK